MHFDYSLSLGFLVRASAVHTAKCCFLALDDFTVAALVNFAAAVSANINAWFNGNCNQLGEAFEESSAQFPAFLCEFEDFSFFLANRLLSMCN